MIAVVTNSAVYDNLRKHIGASFSICKLPQNSDIKFLFDPHFNLMC